MLDTIKLMFWRGISLSNVWEYKKDTVSRPQRDLTKSQTLLGSGSYNVKPPKLRENKLVCLSQSQAFCYSSQNISEQLPRFKTTQRGWPDGSVHKGTCCQAWESEFNPQELDDGERTNTCKLFYDLHTGTMAWVHVCTHTNTVLKLHKI